MVKKNGPVDCKIPKFLVSHKENELLWTEIFIDR